MPSQERSATKSAMKSAMVTTCLALVAVLLYPPWMDAVYKSPLGFHFISGNDFGRYSGLSPQIDYLRLLIIVIAVCLASVVLYIAATADATHNAFKLIRQKFKPITILGLVIEAVFTFIEKYWAAFAMFAFMLLIKVFSSK